MILEDSGRLPNLVPVVNSWKQIHAEIAGKFAGARGAFHEKEATQVSVLAGAVTREGGIAYAEFETQKKFDPQKMIKGKSSWKGRVDLGFFLNEQFFVVEAKVQWPNLSTPQDYTKDAKDALKEAIGDTENTLRGFVGPATEPQGLALAFIGPHVRSMDELEKLPDYERNFCEAMHDCDVDVVASFTTSPGWVSQNKHIYTRVYMAVKHVHIG